MTAVEITSIRDLVRRERWATNAADLSASIVAENAKTDDAVRAQVRWHGYITYDPRDWWMYSAKVRIT
jgi:hypothetical protein